MTGVPLGQLAAEVSARYWGDCQVTGLTADTRLAKPGEMFVCMPSPSRDTHELLSDAARAGCVAAVVRNADGQDRAQSLGLASLLLDRNTPGFMMAVSLMARRLNGDPSAKLKVIGVTGTNGKTTVAWMVKHALDALGCPCAYLGTLGFICGDEFEETSNTTPFPAEVWSYLSRSLNMGAQAISLEVSSHALAERRIGGMRFDVGGFTNLTQDHLDFHGTMDKYAAAKELLFTEFAVASGKPFTACLNADDEVGHAWSSSVPCKVVSFGGSADLQVTVDAAGIDFLDLHASFGGLTSKVAMRVGGMFNVQNTTTALSMLLALGYSLESCTKALETVPPVPGRFEPVPNNLGFNVIVDYAHTPDALEKLLSSVRPLTKGKIITVFGCGGDRDRTKRPLMGRVASRLSDIVVMTSDNPRTEDPESILNDIEQGTDPAKSHREADRGLAVRYAVSKASREDVVVIAGKGHENYQIIQAQKIPMDDRDLVRQALEVRV